MTHQSVSLILGVLFLLLSCSGDRKEVKRDAPSERVFDVKTIRARLERTVVDYTTVGWVESGERVTVRAEVSGVVKELMVEEGDRVKTGTPLLKIDDSLYRAQVSEVKGKLEGARAELENLKRIFSRREDLYNKGLISEEELQETQTRLESAKATVESLESALERAQINLEKTLVLSEVEGIVGKRYVSRGDYVNPQSKLFDIVGNGDLRFVFRVPQEVRGSIKRGKRVRIRVGRKELPGVVFYLSPSADRSRLFTVKARIKNPEGLRDGLYGEVSFPFKRVKAFRIPEQSLQLSQRQSFVWVVKDSRAVRVPVEVLHHGEGEVLVRGELVEGDRVVVEGLIFLYEGAKVREK